MYILNLNKKEIINLLNTLTWINLHSNFQLYC